MSPAPAYQDVDAVVFWPARTNLGPVEVVLQGPISCNRPARIKISYESVLHVADVPFAAVGWTRLDLQFQMPFNGGASAFAAWLHGDNGRRTTIDRIISLQNLLIDHVKDEVPYHADIDNLRHFGPAEWPYVRVAYGDTVCVEHLSPALRSDVSAVKLTPTLDSLTSGTPLALTIRGVLRARDLAECGYPTESLLLSFAVLDAVVQKALREGMGRLGLAQESAQALLRNTTQSRLTTFLDPTMKLVHGTSLAEENEALFARVAALNKLRNDAIHNGFEVTRSQARDACTTVFDVLDFLKRYAVTDLALPPRPTYIAL
jgi:hypothetical protein